MYRLLFGHLSAGAESPRVEEAVTMIKSWFHGWSGRSLVIFDGADTVDNADDASYTDLNNFLPGALGDDRGRGEGGRHETSTECLA